MSICRKAETIIFEKNRGDKILSLLGQHLDICEKCVPAKVAQILTEATLSPKLFANEDSLASVILTAQITGALKLRRSFMQTV